MADLNDPLKDSYIGKVGDALTAYTAELTSKGFDPASRITDLTGAGKKIADAGKARADAEKALADSIKNEKVLRDQYYTLATSTVSLVEGVLGKSHPLPVNLRSLRAELIGNQNPNGNPATTATTVKPT